MKRLFAVILAVLMLTLCACGAPGTGDSKGTNGGSIFSGSSSGTMGVVSEVDTQTPALVLTVTINPEFELTLNMTNTILSVKSLNTDAETLLAELDVTGQTYSIGIKEILAEAKEQSFLKDGGTVSVTAEAKTEGVWTSSTETILKKPIEVFQTQNELNISCDLTATGKTEDNGGLTEQTMEQDDGIVNTYYFNANNELVKACSTTPDGTFAEVYFLGPEEQIQIVHYSDGSTEYSHKKGDTLTGYRITADGTREDFSLTINGSGNTGGTSQNSTVQNEDGSTTTYTYHDNGNVATVNTTWPNGDYENYSYNEGGLLTSGVSQRDGAYTEYAYHDNGNLATVNTTWSNGDYGKYSYNEDGIPVSGVSQRDGVYTEYAYHDNGYLATVKSTWPNGDYINSTYRADETMESYEHFMDGNYSMQTFGENGNLLHLSQRGADGSYGETFYDENGNRTGYEFYEANGNYDIQTFYPSSNGIERIKTVETMTDGYYQKILYSESGVPVSSEGKNPDGYWHKYTYYSNGNPATYEDPNQSTVFYENGNPKRQTSASLVVEYDSNGSRSYYNDGSMEAFFSGGRLTKIIVNGTTYTDAETLSQYAAGFGITQ